MHNNVPAPYMMNNQPAPSMAPHMAHGGKAKNRMVLGHFNRSELDQLDHLQGKRSVDHTSGLRKYNHIESLLENQHLMKKIAHHAAEHHQYAHGGQPMHHMINQMKQDGRFGDTEMALIGPRTEHILNHYCGGGSTNPEDGKPEYFLGSLLGGLGQAIIPGLTRGLGGFAKGLGNWDSSKGFGENLKNSALGGLKSAFSSTDEEGNQQLPSMGQIGQSALRGGSAMMNSMGQGNNWQDALSHGAQAGMEGYNSPVAKFGQNMLQSRQGGQDWGGAALRGAQAATEGMDNPLMRGANSMFKARNQGQDWGNAGIRGGMEATRGIDNPLIRGARGVAGGHLAGQDWQQAAGRGMQGAMKGMNNNNPLVQGMNTMGQGLQQGRGLGGSAMRAGAGMMGGIGRQQQQPQRYMPPQQNYFNELPYAGEDEYAA